MLSDREWTVLTALWDSGGAALGSLTQTLRPKTGWSRNTVLTYLTRMEAKGWLPLIKRFPPTATRRP